MTQEQPAVPDSNSDSAESVGAARAFPSATLGRDLDFVPPVLGDET